MDYDRYVGKFSALEYPINITIAKNDSDLPAQINDQPAFILKAAGIDTFENEENEMRLEFRPEKRELTLLRDDEKMLLVKKEN